MLYLRCVLFSVLFTNAMGLSLPLSWICESTPHIAMLLAFVVTLNGFEKSGNASVTSFASRCLSVLNALSHALHHVYGTFFSNSLYSGLAIELKFRINRL